VQKGGWLKKIILRVFVQNDCKNTIWQGAVKVNLANGIKKFTGGN
jgi:hypothetical protein